MRALISCLLLSNLVHGEPNRPAIFTRILRDPASTGAAIHLENGELCRIHPGRNQVVVTTRGGQSATRKTVKSAQSIYSCAVARDGRVALAAPGLLVVEDPERHSAKPLPLDTFVPVRVHFDHEGHLWAVGYLDVNTPEQSHLIVVKYARDLSSARRLSIPFPTGEELPHPSALVHVASSKSDLVILSPLRDELVLIARDNPTAAGLRHRPLPEPQTPSLVTGLGVTAEGVIAISVQQSRKDGNWYQLLRWDTLQNAWSKLGEPGSQPKVLLGAEGDSLLLFRPPNYEWVIAR